MFRDFYSTQILFWIGCWEENIIDLTINNPSYVCTSNITSNPFYYPLVLGEKFIIALKQEYERALGSRQALVFHPMVRVSDFIAGE